MSLHGTSKISWTTHVNPDGSPGGRVADTAYVGKNVIIMRTARVLPGAIVPDNAVVDYGVFYTEDGPITLGDHSSTGSSRDQTG